jgi:hypothetical protein
MTPLPEKRSKDAYIILRIRPPVEVCTRTRAEGQAFFERGDLIFP